jgi:uncharacterized protein (TIGR02996 family)
VSAIATTDDEALLRAVLAHPADDAPRLVYADWLDERGDPRGEYLRVDLELGRAGKRADRLLVRARRLRKELPRPWVVAVSRGPVGKTCWLDWSYSDRPVEYRKWKETPTPEWDEVEAAFRQLWARPDGLVRLRFGTDLGRCEYFDAVRGPAAVGMGGHLEGVLRHFHNPRGRSDVRHRIGFDEVEEDLLCFDLETVIRAAKWAYYYQTFAPDMSWILDSVAFDADRVTNRVRTGLSEETIRLRSLYLDVAVDPDTE